MDGDVMLSLPRETLPDPVAALPSRERVLDLQHALADLPQVDMPVTHHHAPGVYVREVFHPAGVAVVGYEHTTEHLFLLVSGELTVTTDDGMRTLRGPCMVRTAPGTKRAAYAHTDCVVMTIHATDKTDPDAIMAEITVPEPGSPVQDFHTRALT